MRMGKRWLCLLLSLAMGAACTAAGARETATVNNPNPADRLNLRAEPDVKAPALGRYYNGVAVDVLEDVGETWARVQVADVEGYMMRAYLVFGAAAEAVQAVSPYAQAREGGMSLYAGTDDRTDPVAVLAAGEQATVLGTVGDWYHVRAQDVSGYANASRAVLVDPTLAVAASNAYGPGVYWVGEAVEPGFYYVQGTRAEISIRMPGAQAPLRCALADIEGPGAGDGYVVHLPAGSEIEAAAATSFARVVGPYVISPETTSTLIGDASLRVGSNYPDGVSVVRAAPGVERCTYTLYDARGEAIEEGAVSESQEKGFDLERGMTLEVSGCWLQSNG